MYNFLIVGFGLYGAVIFGGRLGEYKYYDMDQVIVAALERVEGLG